MFSVISAFSVVKKIAILTTMTPGVKLFLEVDYA